jgi:CHAD domain-containing protein
MLQDGLYAFFMKHQEEFQAELKKYEITPNEESIRQMHVCIKKMHVIFELLQHLTNGKISATRQLTDFRVISKNTMAIQFFRLQLHLLAAYKIKIPYDFSEYSDYLNTKIREKRDLSRLNKVNIKTSQLIENQLLVKHFILVELQKKEILEGIYSFLKSRFSKIEKLVKEKTKGDLHQIRIWYQEIYYTLSLVNKYHLQSNKFKLVLEKIKVFDRQIMVCHDLSVLRDGFNEYLDKFPTLRYKVTYQTLQSQININAENKRQELQTQLIEAILPQLNKLMPFLKL